MNKFFNFEKIFSQLDKKHLPLIKIAGGCVGVLFLILFVYGPMEGRIKTLKGESQSLESQLKLAHEVIQKSDRVSVQGRLLKPQEVSWAIQRLTQMGKDFNLQFLSINPQPIEELQEFECARLPIEMKLKVEYQDLGRFLDAVKNLKEMVVNVRKFKISRDENMLPLVNVDLTLEIFLEKKIDG